MQVLKFPDTGVTVAQHFKIKLGSDGVQLIRTDFREIAVHSAAPAPETVAVIRPGGGFFRQTRHGALMCVRVQIGDARQ